MSSRAIPGRNRYWVMAAGPCAALVPAAPFLYQVPRGDGHPVLVMSGFGGDDSSTAVLRGFLSCVGYRSRAWKLGTNCGTDMPDLLLNLASRLDAIFTAAGEVKVSLVGWSLGGVYARVLAHHYRKKLRQVITLGSPFASNSRTTPSCVRLLAGERLPGIPSTAVFSKTDVVVPWQLATQQPTEIAENVEVYASHVGLGFNPAVLYAAADRLANREGQWRSMQRTGWKRLIYGPARLSTEH
ncbi:MAG: alpha/beta hydrolase [Pseudomonadales bacterium]|nr:alpha/beta hydrolase [Pseudomonadales bacterium]MDP6470261.1 alpha/beta hydrolase [Pseudomonadales bacterium]MDP6827167.1 alpha/beta hydrolase [Pseudomonadales bacterium]MDP6972402.1 alpha/beta hydrolase [Pseudomonadales bacterium]